MNGDVISGIAIYPIMVLVIALIDKDMGSSTTASMAGMIALSLLWGFWIGINWNRR